MFQHQASDEDVTLASDDSLRIASHQDDAGASVSTPAPVAGPAPVAEEPAAEVPLKSHPNRSVYNLIYDNVEEDDDGMSHSTHSYLEEEDYPLPIITDSESSIWTRCGQCCDCCDHFLRKKRFRCKCGWVRNTIYYMAINTSLAMFFLFVMYMTQVNYYQNPDAPPFKQLLFKRYQYPGVAIVPLISTKYSDSCAIWSDKSSKNENLQPASYVNIISKLIHKHSKACETSKRCNLDTDSFGPCKTSDYGYNDLKPCLFLKLNKLTIWEPEEYVRKSDIPEDVPEALRSEINVDSARLWIACHGLGAYDQEIIGKVEYYPGPYFNSSIFPLTANRDTNPIITIRLIEMKTGFVAKLVCGVYAKNVHVPEASYVFIYLN